MVLFGTMFLVDLFFCLAGSGFLVCVVNRVLYVAKRLVRLVLIEPSTDVTRFRFQGLHSAGLIFTSVLTWIGKILSCFVYCTSDFILILFFHHHHSFYHSVSPTSPTVLLMFASVSLGSRHPFLLFNVGSRRFIYLFD